MSLAGMKRYLRSGGCTSLVLNVSQLCNMRCQFCYASDGTFGNPKLMTLATAKRAVDFLLENSESRDVYIIFCGGEPLLNWPIIEAVVVYSRRLEKTLDRNIHFVKMGTNGTLFDLEKVRFCERNNVDVLLGFEGLRRFQESDRPFVSSKRSSYDAVKDRIEKFPHFFTACNFVVSKRNVHALSQVITNLSNLGLQRISFSLIQTQDLNLLLRSPEDFTILRRELANAVLFYSSTYEKTGNEPYDLLHLFPLVQEILRCVEEGPDAAIGAERYCPANEHLFTVDADGNIFGCMGSVNDAKLKLGSIAKGFSEKNLNRIRHLEKQRLSDYCSKCEIYRFCRGGCQHSHYTYSGKIEHINPYFCQWQQALVNVSTIAASTYLECRCKSPALPE